MRTLWILVADAALARVLVQPAANAELEETETLTDAAAHAQRSDLRRDAYGRRGGGDLQRDGGNATSSAGDDELHREADLFARRVADRLAELHRKQGFEGLFVIAEPQFLGRLRQVLPEAVTAVVVGTSNKDLIHADLRTIRAHVAEQLPTRGA